MIIGRSPLRISLGGGATDAPTYYLQHGGFLIAAAIDKYVYTTIHHTTKLDEIILRYSQIEKVKNVEEIKHPIIKEALKLVGITESNIEITSLADIPSGTGLGSSGSFTTALLKTLYSFRKKFISPQDLAELACHIEIDLLKEPIGKQDQYIAACGGLTAFEFKKDGKVEIVPLNITEETISRLEENLVMVSTGIHRSASSVLKEQSDKSKAMNPEMINNLHYVKEMGYRSKEIFESGNLDKFGLLMHEHWEHKKKRSKLISNSDIDKLYQFGLDNGALGGKVCFTPDTDIKTEFGIKKIQDVKVGERVYDHKNNLQKVLEVMNRDYNGELLNLKVKGLKDVIKTTPEHPFLTSIKRIDLPREYNDEGKKVNVINFPIFKEAKDLKKGDFLLTPINTEVIDIETIKIDRSIKTSIYSNHDIYKGIPLEVPVDNNLLNILGWYIAEGSNSYKQFYFSMHKNEIKYAKQLRKNFQILFSKKVSIRQTGVNCINVVGSSVVLSKFLEKNCGKLSKNKSIPDWVMKLPTHKQAVLLRALWEGDGCNRLCYDKRTNKKYNRCSFKTISFKLAKQVQELCFRLGFICSIKEEKDLKPIIILNNKKESIRQNAYSITINGEDAKYFSKFMKTGVIVNFKRKNNKKLSLKKDIINIENTKYVKTSILSIKKENYNNKVFNLNVDKTHTYIANDVAVHNCGAGGGGFILFYTEERNKLLSALKSAGHHYINFKFDYEGTKIL